MSLYPRSSENAIQGFTWRSSLLAKEGLLIIPRALLICVFQEVLMSSLPPCLRLCCRNRQISFQTCQFGIFIFTLAIYACFHISRKPISVVKPVLHPNCSEIAQRNNQSITPQNATFCMWKPFDSDNYNTLFGYLDLSYLLSYAIGMFLSGHIAERMNLRIFLTVGCLLSGVTTALFGCGYFLNIHALYYYIFSQVLAGLVQSSGWPAVVTCMSNWFGTKRRGFILGAWNSHVSLGNILGALLAGACVEVAWGWSFVVPGLVVGGMGVLVYFFLVPYPEDMGFTLPESTAKTENQATETTNEESGRILPQPSPSEFARNDGDYSNLQVSMHPSRENMRPISFCAALAVPGVMEYSLCLFFVKSVAYTFLFWLPMYIREANGLEAALSADLSAIFDSGGIVGGMLAGLITDRTSCSATICGAMLLVAVPTLYAYYLVGASSVAVCICMLLSLGILVVGPYSLITTVVSADLGTDQSLQGNTKALSTVVAIIDGMGSLGAAAGPFIVGLIVGYGWLYIFLVMMLFLILSILFLLRRIVKELQTVCRPTVAYVQMP